ncbi:hypothetical protein BJX66DRAFT_335050 [Aspergillus keveii]|uniref:DUF6604 domain-containing protein n=1 Tax=Aspergillus keveii TaxID=714993 RepID=A0ABR4GFN0_9EURO
MPKTYRQYKRDQKLLVYWMIHASNTIIKSLPPEKTIPTNTTGQITLSSLVALSESIAKHIRLVPSTIYRLFQSVIEARKQTHAIFKQIVADDPDPERSRWRSLASWASDEEDDEEVIFSNKFAGLNMNDEGKEDENEEDQNTREPVDRARSQTKGKKGNGRKGKKVKARRSPVAEEKLLKKVPLDSYRIIEDQIGLHDVAYNKLNSSIAGTLGNITVAMATRTELDIEINCPGLGSYDTLMNMITRGDPERVQGRFTVTMARIPPDKREPTWAVRNAIDVREHFMIHAYQDLIDFVTDFQRTRSGKPTKKMLAELRDWNPTLDLARATRAERLKWRRSYTINWLYNLVNVFSSAVIQHRALKGEHIDLESVDWSSDGPPNNQRR